MQLNDQHADDLARQVDRFDAASILCIGDVMLDHFIYGSATRISPEAPIPVLKIDRQTVMLGGAGNTVRNMITLGAQASFMSVVGNDEAGNRIVALAGNESNLEPYLLSDPKRTSSEKIRYIAAGQQLLRADYESAEPLPTALEDRVLRSVKEDIGRYQVVVMSDYGKGMLTDRVIHGVIETAKNSGLPVIVDPKRRDFSVYREATILTPNARELSEAAGRPLDSTEDLIAAAREQMRQHRIQSMVITRGALGMILLEGESEAHMINTRAREVFDVSGAGDTVIATLAVALASGSRLADAVELANAAAGIVVGKIGTSVVYRTDLKVALLALGARANTIKIAPRSQAAQQVEEWKREGLRVGFTNGCFDLIHAGHLGLINDSRSACDRLVVAINADASVRRLKGSSRPVNTQEERALLLCELSAVDMVVVFEEDTPEALLTLLKPDILMKGADYSMGEIVGSEFVMSYGGEVKRIALREGYSSTNIIERITRKAAG
ncbi:MAG: D-glycero-beta-D-manno-heptose-7-phosphate kinase [Rickettsiales bacterium]|nr:D-glycero-beta-D-manno-heptose-7-phosphate kinase [Rickettsiales bacterium]